MIPPALWNVLNESERLYLCALMDAAAAAQNLEEFTATVHAIAALLKDGPETKITLSVAEATEAELDAIRAQLTPEERKHVRLELSSGTVQRDQYGLQPENTACDFCQAQTTEFVDYTAQGRIVAIMPDGKPFLDEGIWGACSECAAAINAGRWEELRERAIIGVIAGSGAALGDSPQRRAELRSKITFMIRAVFGVELR